METNYLLKVKIDDESTIVCTFLSPINVNSLFIVNNQDALYIGKVLSCDQIKEDIDLSIYEKGVRIPTNNDIKYYQSILKEEESLIKEIQKEANNLQLDMKIFKVSYSFDKTKFKILYTSDNRVDFRELLKTLAKLVKARIEMKQVGPRDKAKTIGGLGVCGLKLCCSTFLNSFDGITISMAKNQMLAINIPKLSGQCGKLMCCLKYEDVNYTKLHPLFPKLGTQVNFENTNMSVTSINMLLMTVVLYDGNKYVTLKLEDFNQQNLSLQVLVMIFLLLVQNKIVTIIILKDKIIIVISKTIKILIIKIINLITIITIEIITIIIKSITITKIDNLISLINLKENNIWLLKEINPLKIIIKTVLYI